MTKATRILYLILAADPVPARSRSSPGSVVGPVAVLAFAAIFVGQKPLLVVLQGAKGPGLIPVLGGTGQLQLVYGVLLAAGLFISA